MNKYLDIDKIIKANMYKLVNDILKSSEKSKLDENKLKEIEKFLILDFWINLYLSASNEHEKELIIPIMQYYKDNSHEKPASL